MTPASYMYSMGNSHVFLDDNVSCHRSQMVVVQESETNEVWPPKSPDLNPIEHVLDFLEAKVNVTEILRELEGRIKEQQGRISAIDV